MLYLPYIDGLRAIAVLSVILYHFNIAPFFGGYAGVDVFFVISGFLITRIINTDLENNEFSFIKFYLRRVFRILPVFILVVFLSFICAHFLLMPKEMIYYGNSLIGSLFFISNIIFRSENNYFDLSSETKPLLHIWSLSIEEQFYLVLPLILYFSHKYLKNFKVSVILSLTLISYYISTIYSMNDSFYSLEARAWELLFGSLLAMNILPKLKNKFINEMLSTIGLSLIIYVITGNIVNYKLYVCFATFLLIQSHNNFVIHKILSNKILRFIGKISFSLYLWHWVIYVYVKYYYITELSFFVKVLTILIIFLLSTFTYKFIEKPGRGRIGFFKNSKKFISIYVLISFLLILYGYYVSIYTSGFPERFNKNIIQYANVAFENNPDTLDCTSIALDRLKSGDICHLGNPRNGKPEFIVIGDSNADAYMPGFKNLANKQKIHGFFIAKKACIPTLSESANSCAKHNFFTAEFIRNSQIKNVVIIASWNIGKTSKHNFCRKFKKYINIFDRNRKIYVFHAHARYKVSLPSFFARKILLNKKIELSQIQDEDLSPMYMCEKKHFKGKKNVVFINKCEFSKDICFLNDAIHLSKTSAINCVESRIDDFDFIKK